MRRPPVRRGRDREGKFRWGVGMCSCRDRVLTVGSPTLTTLRVLFHPRNKLFLGHDNSAADFQYREVRFVHQLVTAGRCYTQHFCHYCCIEEQRQVIITFVLRYFHVYVWFPFFRIGTQREKILLRLCWIPCWPRAVHLPAPGFAAAFSPCWHAHPVRGSWRYFTQGVCTPAVGIHLSMFN